MVAHADGASASPDPLPSKEPAASSALPPAAQAAAGITPTSTGSPPTCPLLTLSPPDDRWGCTLYDAMTEGLCIHEIVCDDCRSATDYRIVGANRRFRELVGVDDAVGRLATEVYGVSPAPFIETYARVAATGKSERFETYFAPLGAYYDVSVFSTEPGTFVTLFRDVTKERQERTLMTSLASLYGRLDELSPPEVLREAVAIAIEVSHSEVGYLHFVDTGSDTVEFRTWSKEAEKMCRVGRTKGGVRLSDAGIWAESVRTRRPAIHNDYPSTPHRKGLPPGHAPIRRHLSVPIFDGDTVVAALGVGNKAAPYTALDAEVLSLLAPSVWTIHERKRSSLAIAAAERRYREAMEVVNEGLWDWSFDDGTVHFSPSYYQLLGYRVGEFAESYASFERMLHPEDRDAVLWQIERTLKRGEPYDCTFRMVRKDGRWAWIRSKGKAVELADDGAPRRAVGTHTDVTDQRQMEAHVRREYEKFRSVVDHATEGVVLADENGTVIEWNRAMERLTGTKREQVIGKPVSDPLLRLSEKPPQSAGPAGERRPFASAPSSFALPPPAIGASKAERADRLHEFVHPDGRVITLEFDGYCVPTDAGFRTATIVRDATQRVEHHRRLAALLAERETLLREMNHRVKNNLMMLVSLVQIKQEEVGEVADLANLQHQIEAIQALHELLYQSHRVDAVDLHDYIQACVLAVFDTSAGGAVFDVDADRQSLVPRVAIPLGLIVNEVATNALKHGRQPGKPLHFGVSAKCTAEGECILSMTNDGPPLPADPPAAPESGVAAPDDVERIGKMGLRLVRTLVDQLDGTLTIRREPHPEYTIRFRLPKPQVRKPRAPGVHSWHEATSP